MIESHGITIIRTNLDDADFDMNELINQKYMQIIKSTKKPLIDDLSKRLLELEFKSNHSIKSKCLKWIVKNIFPNDKKMKNTQSKMPCLQNKKVKICERTRSKGFIE